jgi:hypothetical protein
MTAEGPASAAERFAHSHPVLRRLAGWAWEEWVVPGPAADRTLVGHRVGRGVLVSLFVQTEEVATARWTTMDSTPREVGVVHGSVAEVVARIAAGPP